MGSVFGGGKGTPATVTGDTEVLLRGSVNVKRDVFDGGHVATVESNTHVLMQRPMSRQAVAAWCKP